MTSIRSIAIAAFVLAIGTTSAVVHADKSQHQEKFCTELSTFHTDLAKVEGIGPNSTVHELRMALDQAAKDAKKVEAEAAKMTSASAKQFTQSAEQLYTESHNLPENMTIAQARSRIGDDIQNVKQSAQALATESGCPNAMPPMHGGTETPPSGETPPSAPPSTPPSGETP